MSNSGLMYFNCLKKQCCVPEASALREFVSRPPTGSVRLHCTMIRHDDDSNLSSGTCYTLYLEYLGGLVPLLKGKRTSKIRPEFVIFDPQLEGGRIISNCSFCSNLIVTDRALWFHAMVPRFRKKFRFESIHQRWRSAK